ncbi:MAG: hypothetical protein M5U30_04095 [Burkholderiaceae bacterium]|nr:hypothetical protein [Burkholderiaceae bacterium]
MVKKPSTRQVDAARQRIAKLRARLGEIELLCSGSLSERMMKCGKPNCRCATDPSARHGPYYEWGRMRAGKIAHRYVTPEQAKLLRQAIDNYRLVKKTAQGPGGRFRTTHRRSTSGQALIRPNCTRNCDLIRHSKCGM